MELTYDDILRSIVMISPIDDLEQTGLGVISGNFVLTCAHHRTSTSLMCDPSFYHVRRIADDQSGTLCAYASSSIDFMALSWDGLMISFEGGEPLDGWIISDMSDHPTPTPTMWSFTAPGGSHHTRGFFFSPDGNTRNDVEMTLHDGAPWIEFDSTAAVKGCSGGPLFTSDHRLVGIFSSIRRSGTVVTGGLAVRIDLAAPMLMGRLLAWDHAVL
jgi:hypothetical protein